MLFDFTTWWINLFSHSPKARLLWNKLVYRYYLIALDSFGDVELFLRRNEDLAPATRTKLLHYFDDPNKKAYLQIQLAVSVDAGMPFVKATYTLEGDGPLAFQCYEIMSSLTAAHTIVYYTIVIIPRYSSYQSRQRREE